MFAKRELFIIAVTTIGIIMSFSDAFYGLILYTFYSFANPLELATGLRQSRLSYFVAAAVIATALIQKKRIIPRHRIAILCILFILFCFFILALRRNATALDWEDAHLLFRIITMTLVSAALIHNQQELRIYILAIAAFVGLLGAYYGIAGLLKGSTGISGNFPKGDNTSYGLSVVCALPFIYYAGQNLKKFSWRVFAKMIFFGNAIAVIVTYSRGGFLALGATLALQFLDIKRKWLIIMFVLMACLPLYLFWPSNYKLPSKNELFEKEEKLRGMPGGPEKVIEGWRTRMETLLLPQEKVASAVSRTYFWQLSIKMLNDNPLTGVGYGRFHEEYDNYDITQGLYGTRRSAHNTIFVVLAETGYTGFLIFASIVFMCLAAITRAKRRAEKFLDQKLKTEFLGYANMLRISFVAFFVGSFFTRGTLQEIFWAVISISIAIDLISRNILKEQSV